jgi:hypothetical protein
MLRKMAKNHALAATLGEKHSRRTRGDNALSSSAALIFFKLVANSADNFAMKRRSGGRQFKSTLLHHPISRFSDISENRSKTTRVRAIYECARTGRTSPAARIGEIRQNLSARDFARSMEIRQKFADGAPNWSEISSIWNADTAKKRP